ncbi:hypothetical protein AK830_g4176 [Neonectria ditissima]|uniref:Uncharacterized protein n=1 Tax=Neonectria ditissima TaxID=78410 RepID=A0A0P7BGL2_9HYPO|nr:hypothetical protein AK830_g4176 [Neonectria ditissima]
MHFTNFIATAVLLASGATATPVDLEARKTLPPTAVNLLAITGTDIRFQTKTDVFVELNKLTHVENLSITELRVKGITVNQGGVQVPHIDNVVCQRYLNKFGTQVGSERFTKKAPALIDTNEVDFAWVMCYVVKN